MSKMTPFLEPRMDGGRFESHTIPLEVLKDLAALESMLVEVAKWHYFKANPDKQRCPNGFTNGVSLRLEGVDEGSAIPKIVLVTALTFLAVGSEHYFNQARASIIAAIDAAQHNEPLKDHLPEHLLSGFDRIGRSLHDDEFIEFNPTNRERPARLDKETRHKLVLASSKVKEYTEDVVLRGLIVGVDIEKSNFKLKLMDGQTAYGPITPQHHDKILEALTGCEAGVKVKVQGIGIFNRYELLKSIESIEHLSILPPRDIGARLDEFRNLKAGWFDGIGATFKGKTLDWLTGRFDEAYEDNLPLPYLYPTPQGGVRAEWRLSNYEASLEVDLTTYHGEWVSFEKQGTDETEMQLDLSGDEGWQWINTELKSRLMLA